MRPRPRESTIRNARHRLLVIDRIWHALGGQLRNPRGTAGSIVGWLMAWINDEPNRLAIDVRQIDHCRGTVRFLGMDSSSG